ncbi:unnamed protein product [Hymenolepis diminuta]|uniref:Uncharacterized protein n=1 Tax=Hymenolepis diminuta TaxID=6216 RepID=A0A564Z289_HYMDI|nr:unnamed protein product [Hymenolepis diminuta]
MEGSDYGSTDPPPLKRLCARSIAENFESMIKQTSNGTKPEFEWFFPLSDWYIAPPAADILLEELGNRKKLTKEHFSLFLNPNIGMHSVSLRNIYLTPSSISFLKDFALYKLTAENVRGITLNDLIDNLSKSTFKDLHTLNVSRISFDAQSNGSVVLPMEQFKNLQHLNISNTKINSRCLNDLVKFLPRLRYLDISETEVNDITSLKDLKETLVGLIMHQIPLETDSDFEMALSVLLDLKELRVLDLSHIGYTATLRLPVVDLFIQSQFAPHLKHLDISGNPFRLTRIDILDLIKNHSNLQFLGLIAFNTDLKEFFEKFPTLEIIDGKGEEQITKIIKRYVNRPFYLKCAFESISESIEIDAEVDGEEEEHIFTFNLLELVISTLEGLEISYVCFPEGIMSIVNLTKSLTWKDLPVELLNRLMNLTFRVTDKLSDEMFFYPCQDIFLHLQGDHRISFDYKRYCELLFHNLRRFHFATSVFHTIHLILNNCLESISETDLNEISINPLYIQTLIKTTARLYLSEGEVHEVLVEDDKEKLSYLQNFIIYLGAGDVFTGNFCQPHVFRIFWELVVKTHHARKNVVELGGCEILTKILRKIEWNSMMAENTAFIKDLLRILVPCTD